MKYADLVRVAMMSHVLVPFALANKPDLVSYPQDHIEGVSVYWASGNASGSGVAVVAHDSGESPHEIETYFMLSRHRDIQPADFWLSAATVPLTCVLIIPSPPPLDGDYFLFSYHVKKWGGDAEVFEGQEVLRSRGAREAARIRPECVRSLLRRHLDRTSPLRSSDQPPIFIESIQSIEIADDHGVPIVLGVVNRTHRFSLKLSVDNTSRTIEAEDFGRGIRKMYHSAFGKCTTPEA